MKKLVRALLAGALALMMCACNTKTVDVSNWFAGDGNLAGNLKSFEIDWVDGSVEITYGKSEEIKITERPVGNLSEEQKAHWILDGTTLKVQYSAEKKIKEALNKRLVIEIPENVNLDSLEINGASCEIKSIVSAERIDVNTASGNVNIDTEKSKNVSVASASGDLSVSMKDFNSVDIETASGNVTVWLPKDGNFTAEVETNSGKVKSELKMTEDGNKYTNGTGASKVKIETASGNVEFKKHTTKVRDLVYK